MKLTFSKNERTLSKKRVQELYSRGFKLYSDSFTLIWHKQNLNSEKIRLLISVPKKNIKKAVDRNYVKRLIKECYKINKITIYKLITTHIEIILIYNKIELPQFNKLREELLTLFKMLRKKINETT